MSIVFRAGADQPPCTQLMTSYSTYASSPEIFSLHGFATELPIREVASLHVNPPPQMLPKWPGFSDILKDVALRPHTIGIRLSSYLLMVV